jgi:arylformamidase
VEKQWICLSHKISDKLSAYGNGGRVNLTFDKQISCGDACNNSHIDMSLHYGTHIDFPFHFYERGKKACEYGPDFFVSENVAVIDERYFSISDSLIEFHFQLIQESFSPESDVILINTGFYKNRHDDIYWNKNPSFKKGEAAKLRKYFPRIKFLGIDSISINPWVDRLYGREVHKEFLVEEDILLIEDIDYSRLPENEKISELIISPLIFEGADAAPATLLARI